MDNQANERWWRMRRGKKTPNNYYRHAKKRFEQRYGLDLTRYDYDKMILEIQSRKTLPLWVESNSRTHHLIMDQYIAVYDKERKCIRTFLPPEAINKYLPSFGKRTA